MSRDRTPHPHATMICANCGGQFTGPTWNGKRKFCSRACYKAANLARIKENYRLTYKRKGRDYSSITGANCHLWKGGKSSLTALQRSSPEYKAWRLAVWQRDWFTCRQCGTKSNGKGNIVAHHIKPWRDYPDLRFDVSNGVTYCRSCHNVIDDFIREERRGWAHKWVKRALKLG